jgi:hypothetical protein
VIVAQEEKAGIRRDGKGGLCETEIVEVHDPSTRVPVAWKDNVWRIIPKAILL